MRGSPEQIAIIRQLQLSAGQASIPHTCPLNTLALPIRMNWNGTTAFCLAGTGLTL